MVDCNVAIMCYKLVMSVYGVSLIRDMRYLLSILNSKETDIVNLKNFTML